MTSIDHPSENFKIRENQQSQMNTAASKYMKNAN